MSSRNVTSPHQLKRQLAAIARSVTRDTVDAITTQGAHDRTSIARVVAIEATARLSEGRPRRTLGGEGANRDRAVEPRRERRELATARLDRDDLESVLRLIWPSMAELHACFHLSQRRQAARDDAAFNELIARLDEEDDDSDG